MEANWNDDKIISELKQAIKDRLSIAGEVIATKAKQEITELGAVKSGRLRDSINSQMVDDETVAIGTNVEYAPFVELGTAKMNPRPFLRNGMKKAEKEVKELFKDILK